MSTLRQFGIELETYHQTQRTGGRYSVGPSGTFIANGIKAMGYQAKPSNNHFDEDYAVWQIKPDNSLSRCPNGLEVVGRTMLPTEANLEEVTKVANWLMAQGYEVNKETGYHIHIDAADMSSYEAAAVAVRYNANRTEIDGIMPPSRRAAVCFWAKPLAGDDLRKVNNVLLTGQRDARWVYEERYVAVNLQHISKSRSARRLEFRQHSGTLEADKVIGWYKWLCDFIAETLKIIRDNGGAPAATPMTAAIPAATSTPIIRRQRTSRGSTRSVVVGTTNGPRIPYIQPGSDYDLFLRSIEANGVATQQDARTFGWPDTRLRVTAHWLRRHGAELVTTQRNGEVAYVGRNGARTRDAIFTAPAQIRRRVQLAHAPRPASVVNPGPQVSNAIMTALCSAPLQQGISDDSKAWFEKRRAAITQADARRLARARP